MRDHRELDVQLTALHIDTHFVEGMFGVVYIYSFIFAKYWLCRNFDKASTTSKNNCGYTLLLGW